MSPLRKSEVKNVIEKKLGVIFRSGKELTGWFLHGNKKIARITVPKGRDELKRGTRKAIRESLHLDSDKFDSLIACPLKYNDYVEMLKEKKIIEPK